MAEITKAAALLVIGVAALIRATASLIWAIRRKP